MTAAADFCVAFGLQAAMRTVLTAWAGLSGVDIATGPRRQELLERVAIGGPKPTTEYRGGYRSEEGTVDIVADVFKQGSGEAAIDAARDRAKALLNECVAALSLAEQTGGDITAGGAVLALTPSRAETIDNYLDRRGNVDGHGFTASVTFTYTARIVSPGGTP